MSCRDTSGLDLLCMGLEAVVYFAIAVGIGEGRLRLGLGTNFIHSLILILLIIRTAFLV